VVTGERAGQSEWSFGHRVSSAAVTDGDGQYSREDVFLAMPTSVWRGVGLQPYEKEAEDALLQSAKQAMAERAYPAFFTRKPEPRNRSTMNWCERHHFIHKLLERSHKYTIRGIQILNAPAGGHIVVSNRGDVSRRGLDEWACATSFKCG
jgi:hypothetical protein